jgi:hypothetical protein
MITNGYLELSELQESLNASEFVGIDSYELAIESASRWIDDHCSDMDSGQTRYFYQDTVATPRLFHADSRRLVRTGDFDSTSGMTVEIDLVGDGTFTTLDPTLWQPESVLRVNGAPYTQITTTTYTTAFPLGMRPRVRATTRWGWASVPKPVTQACKILAVAFMLGIDVISNEDGYSLGSGGPADPFALAAQLLTPYMLDDGDELAALAPAAKGRK